MKTLEWQNFLAEQKAQHGKVVFSVPELANAARTTLHAVNTELGRLVKRGLLRRYAHGRYGPTQGVSPEEVVRAVDPGAYITGFYVLALHHLVTQAPTVITCFTHRRHNRKADRNSAGARLRFIFAPRNIYARPAGRAVASPEQALCDFAWLNLREGVDPQSLVTFHKLNTLNRRRLNTALGRYPEQVRTTVGKIMRWGTENSSAASREQCPQSYARRRRSASTAASSWRT